MKFLSVVLLHIVFGVFYGPSNSDIKYIEEPYKSLEKLHLLSERVKIILMGDFNFPDIEWNLTAHCRICAPLQHMWNDWKGSFMRVAQNNISSTKIKPRRNVLWITSEILKLVRKPKRLW